MNASVCGMRNTHLPAASVILCIQCSRRGAEIAVAGGAQAAEPQSILTGEFRAQEKNLRRIINPEQQRQDGSCGAVTAGHAAVAQINAIGMLAQSEQGSRSQRAYPYIAPRDMGLRQHLVIHCELACNLAEG